MCARRHFHRANFPPAPRASTSTPTDTRSALATSADDNRCWHMTLMFGVHRVHTPAVCRKVMLVTLKLRNYVPNNIKTILLIEWHAVCVHGAFTPVAARGN